MTTIFRDQLRKIWYAENYRHHRHRPASLIHRVPTTGRGQLKSPRTRRITARNSVRSLSTRMAFLVGRKSTASPADIIKEYFIDQLPYFNKENSDGLVTARRGRLLLPTN